MAFMVYQRYTTAVKRAYRDRSDAAEQYTRAVEFRAWLAALAVEPSIRAELVEIAEAIEHGLELVTAKPGSD